jgi:hypothetical protein
VDVLPGVGTRAGIELSPQGHLGSTALLSLT